MFSRAAFAFAASVIFSLPSAYAKTSVAVMPLVAQRISEDMTQILDELLTTDVYQRSEYKVVSATDINSMLGFEGMKSALGCDDVTCAAEIGGALGVDLLLSGTVARLGNELIITLKLIDIQKTELQERISLRIPDKETEYASGIARAVTKLLKLGTAESASAASVASEGSGTGDEITRAANEPEQTLAAHADPEPTPRADEPEEAEMTAVTPPAHVRESEASQGTVASLFNALSIGFVTRSGPYAANTEDLDALVEPRAEALISSYSLDRENVMSEKHDLDDPFFSFAGAMVEYRRDHGSFLATKARVLLGSSRMEMTEIQLRDDLNKDGFAVGVGVAEEIGWTIWQGTGELFGTLPIFRAFADAGIEAFLTNANSNIPRPLMLGGSTGIRFYWLTAAMAVYMPLNGHTFSFEDDLINQWPLTGGTAELRVDGEVEYAADGPVIGPQVMASFSF